NCGAVGSMFVDSALQPLIEKINTDSGLTATCRSNASQWAVSSPLRTNSLLHWCVDSTGKSKQLSDAILGRFCP
ncbi:MAG: hypothetical protein AAB922_01880, partial [Patescibacteria group bacterium]